MNPSFSTTRHLAFAACAALVTVGCGGGGGSASPTPSTPAATAATGNGDSGSGATTPASPTPTPAAPTPPAAPHARHKRCGWIGADTFDAGKKSFLANPDYYDAIHPKWGTLMADGSIRVLAMADDADIMSTAKSHSIKLIPLVDADDVSYVRNAMSSPAAVAAHAQTVTDYVVKHGYDGIELDYEHLWTAADRAPYVALVKAAAASLHAQGKLLTLALPAMDADHADAAYDYVQIQDDVDVMHLMAYDFHYMGGDHLGPLAPKGWVNDVVTRVQSLGHPEKYTLGVANYGIAGGWYTSAKDAASRCTGGAYSSQTDHMTVCPIGHQEAGLAPHCTTSQGDVWFEDVASMTEKAQLAKAHGLGGVGYWTMGDEPDGFFSAMQSLFGN
ncbi:MAG TPA: glycosyl hydrolase family 18 protein [Polyangia bacterium]|nr:glycosyl hydrolase family 18 protein [Polyangia bacterium]